jgi:RNA polymerase sigma-70 factor (ECF subfamily)
MSHIDHSVTTSARGVSQVDMTRSGELAPDTIRRAVNGEEVAQREIFDRYSEPVFRLVFRLAGDVALAEDLTQDVFVRVFDRLRQFRGESKLGTWIHSIAASVALNGLRKRRGVEAREVSIDLGAAVAAATDPIEPDLRDDLRRALERLPLELRMVLVMFDVEGYAHDEIAEIMGVSPGACRMRLARAREAVRQALINHRGNDGQHE